MNKAIHQADLNLYGSRDKRLIDIKPRVLRNECRQVSYNWEQSS